VLRLVCKSCSHIATEVLIDLYLKHLHSGIEVLQGNLSSKWGADPSAREGERLASLTEKLSRTAEELNYARSKIDEKKRARGIIWNMQAGPETKLTLLNASSLSSEMYALRQIAEQLRKTKEEVEPKREIEGRDPLRVYPDDLGRPSRFGPREPRPFPGGAPPLFGEPDADHLPPPGWERDRLPPGPDSPFFNPLGRIDPFNPSGGRGPSFGPRFL